MSRETYHRLSWLTKGSARGKGIVHGGSVRCSCGAIYALKELELDGDSILISPGVLPVFVHKVDGGRESGERAATGPTESKPPTAVNPAIDPHQRRITDE